MIHVVMMATPEIDWYSKASRANWAKYCHRHGYKYSVIDKIIIEDMHLNWSRIRMALDVLSDPSAEWVFVVDADSYVLDFDRTLESVLQSYTSKDVIFCRDAVVYAGISIPLSLRGVRLCRSPVVPCAGLFFVRNTAFGKGFLADWIDLAREQLAHLSDRHPRNQSVLWTGLYRQRLEKIAVLENEILSVVSDGQFFMLRMFRMPMYILHDKRMTVRGKTILSPDGELQA